MTTTEPRSTAETPTPKNGTGQGHGASCLMNRRDFLLTSGIATFTLMVALKGGPALGVPAAAQISVSRNSSSSITVIGAT